MAEGRNKSLAPTPGWTLVQTFYVLLLGVSAVGFLSPFLDTREGRWGVGLALANFTLVLVGVWLSHDSPIASVNVGRGGRYW